VLKVADDQSKKRLGRGLAALIGEMDQPVVAKVSAAAEDVHPTVMSDRVVPIENIRANPNNPRRVFTDSDLEDLSNSISEHGVVQPILVRPAHGETDRWEIIAGERRWRASQRAGIHTVPIIVRDVDDRQALELAIIENVQRADLNPVEEALGYQQLIDDHNYRQADLGKVIGKSRSHVANTLRLLKLPDNVRGMVSVGALSSGHARALITLENPAELAEKIVKEGLSVRQAEQLAGSWDDHDSNKKTPRTRSNEKDADTRALEKKLADVLGMKVAINHKSSGKGKVVLEYKTLEQLDELERRLS
jgi:ParB family chromosome partitioning protein